MKKICLISLPWQAAYTPSSALGTLAAFLKHHKKHIQVDSRYDYLTIARRIGESYYTILENGDFFVDMLCFPFLYPEKAESCIKYIAQTIAPPLADLFGEANFRSEVNRQIKNMTPEELARAHEILPTRSLDPESATGLPELTEMITWFIMVRVDVCIENIVLEIAGKYDLVGLTTSYVQLSASLLFCKRLKQVSPETLNVLGGTLVNGRLGPSIIKEYQFIDFIVQGEGEYPLNALVGHLEEKNFEAIERTDGILTRNNAIDHEDGVNLWQVDNLDELPFPDYDGYAELAGEREWPLPIEGSRGCWWGRCHYCGFNYQWRGYRAKSDRRFAAEIEYLCKKYRQPKFDIVDNIHNQEGIQSLAQALKDTNIDLRFYCLVRANLSPYEILVLSEAGMHRAHIGTEGLSNSFLKKIRKGTKIIQNLQAMKTFYELGIEYAANLIMDYPLSTQDDIEETCLTIRRYAYAYRQLTPIRYHYASESPIDRERDSSSLKDIRNADFFNYAIPSEVLKRIDLYNKSFDSVKEPVSWSRVESTVKWWEKLQGYYLGKDQKPMQYRDCQTLLIVDYLRLGKKCRLYLHDPERELYLYCTKIRGKKAISEKFSARMSESKINECLEQWTSEFIIYKEGERFLSLAPAADPQYAARRIRRMAHEDGEVKDFSLRSK